MGIKNMWPVFLFVIVMVLLAVFIYAASDQRPVSGVVINKIELDADTIVEYDPVIMIYKEKIVPPTKILVVKDDTFGNERKCYVDSATFARYNVGDHVEEKGRYRGTKSE